MRISNNGIKFIKEHEGVRLKAYKDIAGIWTIGYGHTDNVHYADVITREDADSFFLEDIKKIEDAINRLVKVKITQGQFDAIASFIFNLGIAAFAASTLLRRLNCGYYNQAADQFLLWCKYKNPITNKLETSSGLLNRRQRERDLFLNG